MSQSVSKAVSEVSSQHSGGGRETVTQRPNVTWKNTGLLSHPLSKLAVLPTTTSAWCSRSAVLSAAWSHSGPTRTNQRGYSRSEGEWKHDNLSQNEVVQPRRSLSFPEPTLLTSSCALHSHTPMRWRRSPSPHTFLLSKDIKERPNCLVLLGFCLRGSSFAFFGSHKWDETLPQHPAVLQIFLTPNDLSSTCLIIKALMLG